MTAKIFIDGEHGTTGLQIRERLAGRDDIDLLSISHDERRNQAVREQRLREADIAILCLPDDAARESVAMAKDAGTRFIDASTAHRTAPDWVFGFAELEKGQAERIAAAQFVSNPGCYSTGAIALLKPLVDAGVIPDVYPVSINAVSGYTGGGKSLIAQMEDASREDAISANHYAYALTLAHKHIPEIFVRSGLRRRPIMTPNVGRFPQGMLVNLPLHLDLLAGAPTAADLHGILAAHYAGQRFVEVASPDDVAALARIDAEELAGTDIMCLYVCANEQARTANLIASLDNLGKGASGAAVQNLDLMLGR